MKIARMLVAVALACTVAVGAGMHRVTAQSAQSAALAFPSDESYLRLLAPGNETYQVVDGSRMKRLVAEQAAIARRYRDAGHQYWGRILGTEADADTASWMADQLRHAGAENVRLEPIDLPPQWIPRSWEVSASLAGEMATLTSAWPTYASPGTPSDGIEVELVDVGLGMETDFQGRDVRGKAVVIHSIPRPGVIQHSAGRSGAIERADAQGAAAILVVVELPGNPQFALYEVNSSVPTLALGSADGAILQRMLSEANPQRPARLRLRLEVEDVDGLKTASVRGEVPAAAEDAERIVIVAHRDAFFEGASDNASGVATAIELMRYFAQVPRSQRRRTFEVIGTPGHHNLARTGFVWLLENQGRLLERVALLINAEHSSQALVDRWAAELRPTNSLGPFTWRIHGSSELVSIANRAFDAFGVPRWAEMGGPEGEIARVRTLVPSIVLMHAGVLMHSNIETAEAIPEAGLAATTRAYAKIIDQANQLDLAQLVPPAP